MKCPKCKKEMDELSSCCDWQLLDKFNGENITLPSKCIKANISIQMDNDRPLMECEYESGITRHLVVWYCDCNNMFYCFNRYYTFFSFKWEKDNQL